MSMERLAESMGSLRESRSTGGCEAPWFVGRGTNGLAIQEGIEFPRGLNWDLDALAARNAGDENFLRVQFSSSDEEPDELNLTEVELADGSMGSIRQDVPFVSFCTKFEVAFPRADRYGVPEIATERGAANYVLSTLGFRLHPHFEAEACDTGDDSLITFKLTALVHRDCLQEQQGSRAQMNERG